MAKKIEFHMIVNGHLIYVKALDEDAARVSIAKLWASMYPNEKLPDDYELQRPE